MSKEELKKETLGCIIRKNYQRTNEHDIPYCTLYYITNQREQYECPYRMERKTQAVVPKGAFPILQDYYVCEANEYALKERRDMYIFLKDIEESWENL